MDVVPALISVALAAVLAFVIFPLVTNNGKRYDSKGVMIKLHSLNVHLCVQTISVATFRIWGSTHRGNV